jgi:hypothetical protein
MKVKNLNPWMDGIFQLDGVFKLWMKIPSNR